MFGNIQLLQWFLFVLFPLITDRDMVDKPAPVLRPLVFATGPNRPGDLQCLL